jgi:uncharacterized protein (TIGR00661 family)
MTGKKVLLVPLNWGLGHATRVIPIIKLLLKKGFVVYIAGSPPHLVLLTSEFDNLNILQLPYLKIKLNNSKSLIFSVIWQAPVFLLQIIREHKALKKLLKKQNIDIVISDNCYGLWNRKVYSIFITHQLSIKLPKSIRLFEKSVNLINHFLIGKFNICWVPDFEKNYTLGGELSHQLKIRPNYIYIGPLSRFFHKDNKVFDLPKVKIKQILFIISGPETQRTLFENIIKAQIVDLEKEYTCIIVRGLPAISDNNLPAGWFNHVSGNVLENFIRQSEFIVCRPGYSTVMDLIALQKLAIVVPTPGQSEQEYLAKYLENKGIFCWQDQEKLDVLSAIEILRTRQNKFIYPNYNSELLEKVFEKPPFKG